MSRKIKIYVPRDAAALSVGANDVAKGIFDEASSRGLDVEVIRNGSRGMLWLEPLVEVDVSGTRQAYGPVMSTDVHGLFDAMFYEGGAHPLALGPTEDIPFFKKQERLTFARCGLTDPLSLDDYCANDGYSGLQKALKLSSQQVCEAVLKSGLRGRGGAGFPAGIKWQTVLTAQGSEKYICCNADEGDSGTFADRMIMEGDPFCVIEGMTIAAYAVGASKGYIYLRSEYPHAHEVLEAALETARRHRWLGSRIGDTDFTFDIEVRKGAGAYICGEETSMLESLEGKRGLVRAKPPIPALEGLFGKPTVVNNVLTLAAVPIILAKGAAYYESFGMGRSRGTQPFQIGGNIKCGGLIEKSFGLSLRELIYDFGGGTRSGRQVKAVQVGGPLGAYLNEAQFDLALDYEEFAVNNAMLGHGGVVVFDDSADMVKQARFAFEFCAIESCGKCTPCRIGSQRGVEVLDDFLAGKNPEDNLALIEVLCELMTDGSLCAMGGLTPMPVQSAMRNFEKDFEVAQTPKKCAAGGLAE